MPVATGRDWHPNVNQGPKKIIIIIIIIVVIVVVVVIVTIIIIIIITGPSGMVAIVATIFVNAGRDQGFSAGCDWSRLMLRYTSRSELG